MSNKFEYENPDIKPLKKGVNAWKGSCYLLDGQGNPIDSNKLDEQIKFREESEDQKAPVISSVHLGPYKRRYNPICVEEMEIFETNEELSLNQFLDKMNKMKDDFIRKANDLSLNDPNQEFQVKIDYHYGTYKVKLYRNLG